MVQNQAGNKPLRWSKRGVVVEVLPHRQYKVRMDGSRRITLRNRKFLRKFSPLHKEQPQQDPVPHDERQPPHHDQQPVLPVYPDNEPDPGPNHAAKQVEPQHAAKQGGEPAPLIPPSPTPPISDWPIHDQQVLPTPEQSDPPPLPVLMHPTPSPVRRSSRSNKGVTRMYDDYETGQEFDAMCTYSLRGHPYQRHFSAMSAPVAYPKVALSGYDVPCPTYDQLNQIHGAELR